MDRIIGIGESIISKNTDDTLKTFTLASCVAVTVYAPNRKAAGMIHIVLPAPGERSMERANPCYFASSGVPHLINRICKEYGCLKGELIVNLYGGANSIRKNDVFNIGKRNIEAVKSLLYKMNITFNDTATGGSVSRTIEMQVATGSVSIHTQPISI